MLNSQVTTNVPRTVEETDAFFQSGVGAAWLQEFGDYFAGKWSWDLYHGPYTAYVRNSAIAEALETRGDDLTQLLAQLEGMGLTVSALAAFERVQKGQESFSCSAPDYTLPAKYRTGDHARHLAVRDYVPSQGASEYDGPLDDRDGEPLQGALWRWNQLQKQKARDAEAEAKAKEREEALTLCASTAPAPV